MTGIWGKARRQIVKDYVAFPLLSGPTAPFTFAANFTANMVRNVWAHSIIFCGHFPDQTYTFSQDEFEASRGPSRGRSGARSTCTTSPSPQRPERLASRAPRSLRRAGEGTRTPDLPLTRRLLYQLSYSGVLAEDRRGASAAGLASAGP